MQVEISRFGHLREWFSMVRVQKINLDLLFSRNSTLIYIIWNV